LMKSGKGKRDDGKGEEKHDKDGVSPDPPIAFLDLPELLRKVVVAGFHGRGNGAVMRVTHR